jgi:hypothetical protein
MADTAGAQTAVTVWWVVFNQPQNCATTPCSLADLFEPSVEASIFWATGALVPAGGQVSFVASAYETSAGFADVDPVTSLIGGPGLGDSRRAEIHVVVRSHGEALEGLETRQITQFLEPGCQDLGGPNVCEDIQVAIHLPANALSAVFDFNTGVEIEGASSRMIRGDGVVKVILETQIPHS